MRTLLLLTLLIAQSAYSAEWSATKVTSGLSVPWGMASMGEGYLMVTEKTGQVIKVRLADGQKEVLFTAPNVEVVGQGGLMDVARSPFDHNQYYFTFSKSTRTGVETALASATLSGDSLKQWKELLTTQSNASGGRHFGSRIAFDSNSLYFSVGDRGERENGQDLSTHSGSILRVDMKGKPLKDNPFINHEFAQPEIWSYGHRNPQGLAFDAKNAQLWSIEHGPRGGDEVNLIKRKANYGWPFTSHGKEYWGPLDVGEAKEKPGIESPKLVYIPSIAPGSLILYRGQKYPALEGKLLAGSLKLTHLNVLTINNEAIVNEHRILEGFGERIRALIAADDGYIYFSTDNGNIYRLTKPQS